MTMNKLRKRIEVLEKLQATSDKAGDDLIQQALYQLSLEDMDFLIDATLALVQGQDLSERQATARQNYFGALQTECRSHGLKVTRIPQAPELIVNAGLRRVCTEDMLLFLSAARAWEQGFVPSAEELAAVQKQNAVLEAQYQRAGFTSKDECDSWHANANPVPANQPGMGR